MRLLSFPIILIFGKILTIVHPLTIWSQTKTSLQPKKQSTVEEAHVRPRRKLRPGDRLIAEYEGLAISNDEAYVSLNINVDGEDINAIVPLDSFSSSIRTDVKTGSSLSLYVLDYDYNHHEDTAVFTLMNRTADEMGQMEEDYVFYTTSDHDRKSKMEQLIYFQDKFNGLTGQAKYLSFDILYRLVMTKDLSQRTGNLVITSVQTVIENGINPEGFMTSKQFVTFGCFLQIMRGEFDQFKNSSTNKATLGNFVKWLLEIFESKEIDKENLKKRISYALNRDEKEEEEITFDDFIFIIDYLRRYTSKRGKMPCYLVSRSQIMR